MINIVQYILKPLTERQQHLRLDESCVDRGCKRSDALRGLLAHVFDTTMPSGSKIHVCHACHNGECSNINHLYWGTAQENRLDAKANGARNVWDNTIAKYGVEKTLLLSHNPEVNARRVNSLKNYLKEHPKKKKQEPEYKRSEKSRLLMSTKKKGSNNNQFSKIWIYNLDSKISKIVEKDMLQQYLSTGWKIGRKIKFD